MSKIIRARHILVVFLTGIQQTGSAVSGGERQIVITYTYDALNRLTAADYSDGTYFHYAYDSVGNRLSQTTPAGTTDYTYDDANRLANTAGVTYTWDANGNLLWDGVYTYTYTTANRLASVSSGPSSVVNYSYNGLGDRVRQTSGGATTNYAIDLAGGLTQALADGTNVYLYGNGRIAQYQGAQAGYFLGDALGSVRQSVDGNGNVTLVKRYEPYGELLDGAGSGATSYGFANEWTDGTGLVYLRARYYAPYLNQFIQPDPIVPDPYTPADWNRYTYARNNPINLADPSGMSPIVDCSQWANPVLANLCKASNGNDNDKATLDARERLFAAIVYGGTLRGVIGSGWIDPSDLGYVWAAAMLAHFLDGNGSKMSIMFSASDPFVNDPGITRATRNFGEQASRDETDFIVPLLHSFLTKYVQPDADPSGNSFTVGPEELGGKDHYFNDPSKGRGLDPRARSRGFWAAFGHVVIDGTFSAEGKYSCRLGRYLVNYSARYLIKDHYGWYPGVSTPFPFGHGGSTVWIPHEWELSLVQDGRAAEYDYTISWVEKDSLSATSDFSQFTQAHWWDWYR